VHLPSDLQTPVVVKLVALLLGKVGEDWVVH
jgi:hypothetical protein